MNYSFLSGVLHVQLIHLSLTIKFDFQQLHALPTLYLYVLYLSENKQRHLLHTT